MWTREGREPRREREMPRYGFSNTGKLHRIQLGGMHHSHCGLAYIDEPMKREDLPAPLEYLDRCGRCFRGVDSSNMIYPLDLVNYCLRVGIKITWTK